MLTEAKSTVSFDQFPSAVACKVFLRALKGSLPLPSPPLRNPAHGRGYRISGQVTQFRRNITLGQGSRDLLRSIMQQHTPRTDKLGRLKDPYGQSTLLRRMLDPDPADSGDAFAGKTDGSLARSLWPPACRLHWP